GGELRAADNRRTAVGKARRLDHAGAIRREVFAREHAAGAADIVREGAREVALVEIAPPGAREPAQRVGEPGELDARDRPADQMGRREGGRLRSRGGPPG